MIKSRELQWTFPALGAHLTHECLKLVDNDIVKLFHSKLIQISSRVVAYHVQEPGLGSPALGKKKIKH